MTQHTGIRDAAHAHPHYSDAFVIFAVTVLSLACGAYLFAHIGLSLWWATLAALAVYSVLLAIHLLVRRAMGESGGEREASATEVGRGQAGSPEPAAVAASEPSQQVAPAFDASGFARELAARRAAVREANVREMEGALTLPTPRPAEPFDYRPARPPALSELNAATREAATLERHPDRSRAAAPASAPAPDAGSPSEANVEIIQDLIKKLADELNAPSSGTPALDPNAPSASEDDAVGMIGRSVAALDATARTMRSPATNQAGAQRAPAPAAIPKAAEPWRPPLARPPAGMSAGNPPAPPSLNPQLARIADSVSADQMDVLLEPIHALAEGRTRHFEIAVRLLAGDGTVLEQAEFARAARGSGLMARIDAAKMMRATRVADRLGERGREGCVLTTIAGESLADKSFVSATASQRGADGRMSLVLSFAQGEVRTFTPAHAAALASLAAAGFSFALEEVSDLDMDFATLAGMGFKFVKLDAPSFLEGLTVPGGRIPSSDICRHLADFGLTLIVGRIEDDWLLARILGFGVLFGKGALFGGPKLVKADVFLGSAAA